MSVHELVHRGRAKLICMSTSRLLRVRKVNTVNKDRNVLSPRTHVSYLLGMRPPRWATSNATSFSGRCRTPASHRCATSHICSVGLKRRGSATAPVQSTSPPSKGLTTSPHGSSTKQTDFAPQLLTAVLSSTALVSCRYFNALHIFL